MNTPWWQRWPWRPRGGSLQRLILVGLLVPLWALVALVAFLLLVQAGNVFGPPPPDTTAIAWVGQAQWLLVAWGYWVDRHRRPVVSRG